LAAFIDSQIPSTCTLPRRVRAAAWVYLPSYFGRNLEETECSALIGHVVLAKWQFSDG